MRIEIVEAKSWHCGEIARLLRDEHKSVWIGLGLRVHHELRAMFDASAYRRACLADGRLAAVWGVSGTAAESDGVVWLALAGWATRYPIEIIRRTTGELERMLRTKRTLRTLVFPADRASFWFAKRLGFKVREDVETVFEAVLMELAA